MAGAAVAMMVPSRFSMKNVPATNSASGRFSSVDHDGPARRLDNQAGGDLQPTVVDQPANAVQYRGLRLVGRGVAQQRARLLDRGVLTPREVLQLESANSAVVPDRNSAQLTQRVRTGRPNQPAPISRKPRAVRADGATTLNDSPAATPRRSTASWNA